jgi:hypothetical protein
MTNEEEYNKTTAALHRIANGPVDIMTEKRLAVLRQKAAYAAPSEVTLIHREIAQLKKQALVNNKEYQAALMTQ